MREQGVKRLQNFELRSRDEHFIVNRFLYEDLYAAIKNYSKGKVLDIGCGNKPYLSIFKSVSFSYTGCDIAQSSEQCVDVICPATKLPFPDASFDTVFSSQVIEHVEDTPSMISEMSRVLKKEGHAVISAPFAWQLHEEPYDFFRFSKYGLKYVLQQAGFEIIYIKPNGGKWATIMQLQLNVLMSSRKYRSWRSFLIKHLFITLGFIKIYNRLAVWIDRRYFDDILTLNYVVVARKK
jgi:SAM-dependent methyltransferase